LSPGESSIGFDSRKSKLSICESAEHDLRFQLRKSTFAEILDGVAVQTTGPAGPLWMQHALPNFTVVSGSAVAGFAY
jgi:hypothetical protein